MAVPTRIDVDESGERDDAIAALGVEPRSTRLARWLSSGPIYVVMVGIGLFWLLPTIGLFFLSLRDPADNAETGWWTALSEPSQLTFDNYRELFGEDSQIPESLWNTVLITVPTTVLLVLIAALAAYAFAFVSFPGRDVLFIAVVALLVVPVQVALIPIAELYGNIGIGGSIASVILFHIAFGLPLAIFLLRNFFVGIPLELLEAARMDGAGELRIFFRVVLPLGIPAMAALAIFQFLWVWNDLLVALDLRRSRQRADHGRDPTADPPVQREHRRHRTGRVRVDARAARRVLLVPALLRPGPARRLLQVATVSGTTPRWLQQALARHGRASGRPRLRRDGRGGRGGGRRQHR